MPSSIASFFAAWGEPDPAARATSIQTCFASVSSYADPRTPAPLTDISEISNYVGMFAEMAPGATAEVVKSDDQHGITRATVAFRMADGKEQLGQYFIETTEAGKITRIVGFVGTGATE